MITDDKWNDLVIAGLILVDDTLVTDSTGDSLFDVNITLDKVRGKTDDNNENFPSFIT